MLLCEYLKNREDLALDPEKNRGLTAQPLTVGSHRKVWWLCEKGHSWQAAVYSVAVAGSRCPYCAGSRVIPGQTDLATTHPALAKEWDRDRNLCGPDRISAGSHQKVWWRCEKGHNWQAPPFFRTKEKGCGCPYCKGRRVLPGFNDLQTLRPELARQWHPTLNRGLSAEDVTLGSNKKVWWRCDLGHSWQAAVYSRTRVRSSGCPICLGNLRQSRYKQDPPQIIRQPGVTIEAD